MTQALDPEGIPPLPPASERQGNAGHDKADEMANAIRILTMRTNRMTYPQIAEALGYADRSGARNALVRALERHESETVAEYRALENMALDADERVLRALISDPATSTANRLRAVDARTRLSARRSRLNGMDAPVQVAVSGGALAEVDDAFALLRDVVMGQVVDSYDLAAGESDGPAAGSAGSVDDPRPDESDGND